MKFSDLLDGESRMSDSSSADDVYVFDIALPQLIQSIFRNLCVLQIIGFAKKNSGDINGNVSITDNGNIIYAF